VMDTMFNRTPANLYAQHCSVDEFFEIECWVRAYVKARLDAWKKAAFAELSSQKEQKIQEVGFYAETPRVLDPKI
jgi:hypothetical protein